MLRRPRRLPRRTPTAAAAVAVGIATAVAASGAGGAQRPSPSVEVATAKIAQLGTVLVRGSGHALYIFHPDGASKVACNAACQKIWPPFYAPARGVAKAINGAQQSLIGSVRDPLNGRRIVTYDGWPLYTYVLDTHKDEASGQNVALSGGFWWVLTPAGKINRTPIWHGGGYAGS